MYRFAIGVVVAALATSAPAQEPGLGYRGIDSSGVFPATGLLKSWPECGPELLWKYEVGIGYAGVTVANDHVYVAGGAMSYLYVFTLDGQLEYRVRIGGAGWKRFTGTRSTPLVTDELAVTTTPDANIYAVDLAKREIRWKINAWEDFGSGKGNMGWGYDETPLLHNKTIIFNTVSRDDETPPLVAVRLEDGRQAWGMAPGKGKAYSAADVSASRFVHNGRPLVLAPTWCYLACIDPNNGRLLWEIPSCGEKTVAPVYRDGLLLISILRELAGDGETPAESCPPDSAEAQAGKAVSEDEGMTPRERMRKQRWGGEELAMLRLNEDGSDYRVLWVGRGAPGRYSQAVMLDKRVYCFGSVAGAVERPPDGKLRAKAPDPSGRGDAGGPSVLCLDAETGELIGHVPATIPGHVIAADGMIYTVELVEQPPVKALRPRVSLLKPTPEGLELAGRFVPELIDAELGLRDVDWEASACPVVAQGRFFLRYGPLMAFELRADKTVELRARKRVLAEVVKRLSGGQLEERMAAAVELLALGWKAGPAAEGLVAALKDPDPRIRRTAAEALGKIGPSVTARLVEALCDETVRADGFAATALMQATGADSVAAALVEAAAGSSALRAPVKTLLQAHGTAAVPGLRRIVVTGDRNLRWWAIEILRDLGPAAAGCVPELASTARGDNQWFRALAADALSRIGPPAREAAPDLVALLKHSYYEARRNAAVALGSIGVKDEAILSALAAAAEASTKNAQEATNEKDRHEEQAVSEAATAALKALGVGR